MPPPTGPHTYERRIGRRVAVDGVEVEWLVAEVTGRLRKRQVLVPRPGAIEDISVSGASILGPADLDLRPGRLANVRYRGAPSQVVVRRIEECGDPERRRYGVQLLEVAPELSRLAVEAVPASKAARRLEEAVVRDRHLQASPLPDLAPPPPPPSRPAAPPPVRRPPPPDGTLDGGDPDARRGSEGPATDAPGADVVDDERHDDEVTIDLRDGSVDVIDLRDGPRDEGEDERHEDEVTVDLRDGSPDVVDRRDGSSDVVGERDEVADVVARGDGDDRRERPAEARGAGEVRRPSGRAAGRPPRRRSRPRRRPPASSDGGRRTERAAADASPADGAPADAEPVEAPAPAPAPDVAADPTTSVPASDAEAPVPASSVEDQPAEAPAPTPAPAPDDEASVPASSAPASDVEAPVATSSAPDAEGSEDAVDDPGAGDAPTPAPAVVRSTRLRPPPERPRQEPPPPARRLRNPARGSLWAHLHAEESGAGDAAGEDPEPGDPGA